MKHGNFYGAIIAGAIAISVLWLGRAEIATSIPLMIFVTFWMLLALLLAIRSDTTEALDGIVKIVPVAGSLFGRRASDNVAVVATKPDAPKDDR